MFRRQNPRGLLGDNKRDENPLYGTFWTRFEWLEVAYTGLKVASGGLKWLKVA